MLIKQQLKYFLLNTEGGALLLNFFGKVYSYLKILLPRWNLWSHSYRSLLRLHTGTEINCLKNKIFTGKVFFFFFVVRSKWSHFLIPCELEWVLPGFLGIRFLRSRNAAPDCRASRRLSITPVSSPSGGRERSELILEQWKLNYRKIKGKTPVRFT